MKDRKVIGSSQHEFMMRKSCLTNLVAFFDEITGWVVEGRTGDVVHVELVTLSRPSPMMPL